MHSKHWILRLLAGALAVLPASCGGAGSGGGGGAIPVPLVSAPPLSNGTVIEGFPVTITMFSLTEPQDAAWGVTVGGDGAVWVASSLRMNRVDGNGHITAFSTPILSAYGGAFQSSRDPIATAPDGSVWFAGLIQSNPIAVAQYCLGQPSCTQPVRVTPSGQFSVIAVPPPLPSNSIDNLAKGPDGTVWVLYSQSFTFQSRLAALNPDGTARFEKVLNQGAAFGGSTQFEGMTMGPDGTMYISVGFVGGTSEIWRFDSDGNVISRTQTGTLARDMTFGSDGNLWLLPYTVGTDFNFIERVNPRGGFTNFPLPHQSVSLIKIAAGADGALWYTDFGNREIGRITTTGSVSTIVANGCADRVFSIVSCPFKCENAHGRLWFTQGNAVGRLQF